MKWENVFENTGYDEASRARPGELGDMTNHDGANRARPGELGDMTNHA